MPLASISNAVKGNGTLLVGRFLSAVENALGSDGDVVAVVDLVVHKVSIHSAIERRAPMIDVIRFINCCCWPNATSVDNLDAAIDVGCMTPWVRLHCCNQVFVVGIRSGW